jgi:hypothetical protein
MKQPRKTTKPREPKPMVFVNNSRDTLSFSLRGHGDFIMQPKAELELPTDNTFIQSLTAQGILVIK